MGIKLVGILPIMKILRIMRSQVAAIVATGH